MEEEFQELVERANGDVQLARDFYILKKLVRIYKNECTYDMSDSLQIDYEKLEYISRGFVRYLQNEYREVVFNLIVPSRLADKFLTWFVKFFGTLESSEMNPDLDLTDEEYNEIFSDEFVTQKPPREIKTFVKIQVKIFDYV